MPDQLPGAAVRLVCGIEERAVRLKFRRALRFLPPGPLTPLWRRHPPSHERKHFRRAYGTLRRVVDFLTVETESGSSQLHKGPVTSVPEVRLKADTTQTCYGAGNIASRSPVYEPTQSCLPTSTATVPPLKPGTAGRRRISVTFSVFGSIRTMTVCIGWPVLIA